MGKSLMGVCKVQPLNQKPRLIDHRKNERTGVFTGNLGIAISICIQPKCNVTAQNHVTLYPT